MTGQEREPDGLHEAPPGSWGPQPPTPELTEDGALELSIVMPCLDEGETIGGCVAQAREYLAGRQIAGEILVADNGSTDGSAMIARSLGARVVHVPERGYGHALAAGIAAARGRFVIMGDADGSYDFSALDPFVAQLREGCDLVVGNRFRGGIRPGAMPPLHRYLGNPVLSAVGRRFFKAPVGDFHCGLRGFRRRPMQAIGLRTGGMEFASEMIVKASLNGLKISEVPTPLHPDGRSRPSHLRSWRDGWRHLRFLLLFSPRWLFLYPGLALFISGASVMALLLSAPQRLGGVVLDVNTLVFSAAGIICGFQSAVFWVFAKVFAINHGLRPGDVVFSRILGVMTLEVGALVGLALLVCGLALSVLAVREWSFVLFGPLDPTVSLRLVIPAATLLVLGLQVMLASFFLSVLDLETR